MKDGITNKPPVSGYQIRADLLNQAQGLLEGTSIVPMKLYC